MTIPSTAAIAAGKLSLQLAAQMFDSPTIILILIGVGVVVLVLLLSKRFAKKRSRELESAAISMGYTFEGAGKILASEIGTIPIHIFGLGRSKVIDNVLRGPRGVVIFDYQYITGYGRSQSVHRQTIACFRFPGAAMPVFQLGPAHWWNKVGDVVSHKLIHFDSHPAFNKRFLLRGIDEPSIRAFFTEPLLTYIESLPQKPAWTVEAVGQWLLVYVPGHRPKPAALQIFNNEACTISAQIASSAGTRLTAG